MEGFNSWNVTVEALQLISGAYVFCHNQLDKVNVTLPELDQVVSVTTSTVGFFLTHSPTAVRTLYSFFTQLPLIEYNFVAILLMLLVLYTVYSLMMATFRWVRGLVYGFVRFSLFIFIAYGLIYAFQQFTDNSNKPSYTRTRNHY
ncbi:hypothetical protein G6F57_009041 [Rhizopus arrhizus]|uniref:Uncharacterized protein n=1 Tax=Rhizopus oryzae TaxID=64495 RepID=A0A9P6XKK5_RHIOR|nr:hypothetical protein G6F30_000215 [Rhizopus arrhizus]KAG0983030.1 hypothetical protein G6F29_005851 [Rhizopus arrhizus]KAG0989798.1 hypothetical protein G6F28_009475 [Rhizopus arrhizus]KAG1014936.1 hypothetical protein G6F27_000505 [Rhizopus arrhizus]KAG1031132.1 hypothetical protein G6F26_000260 [Rhizopus arrhizus]